MIHDCIITIGELHMSRTYRRKNSDRESSCTWDWDFRIDEDHRFYLVGKELKKALAEFHSDSPRWSWGVPADFVRNKNRSLRSKNKAILNRAVDDYNDEPMFIPFIHDAMYDYW